MASRFIFLAPDPEFRAIYPHLNQIEQIDILAVNDEPSCFLTHDGKPRPFFPPRYWI
jgi:hypothetical protein